MSDLPSPEEFADENNLEYLGNVVVKGVFFAEFIDENENKLYYYLKDESYVTGPPLEKIGSHGNKTYGIIKGQDTKRLVDDEEPYIHNSI